MPLLDPHDARPIHFVGIAGAGMSALAELFIRRGVNVTGCDANPEGAADLVRLGVHVGPHDPAHVEGARALVVTSAMPKAHPELGRARELGIPVIRRAEALGEVTAGRELVGIAGTHGKTTTTVMTAVALTAAGREPTALVGGRVAAWGGNLLAGGDRLYVVEADEYDRSFLALSPTVAVVTNIEADHLDIYADIADIERAFAQFVRGARSIVLCAEDAGANRLATPSTTEVIRYGITSRDARLVARRIESHAGASSFDVVYDDDLLGRVQLGVPGQHNVLNALAAVGSGLALGADFAELARGLGSFTGAERRFQRLGERGGVLVVDDYAHHPTEIAATLAAARGAFPERRIVIAFQPHLFTRTRDFAREFGAALAAADAVYLTEIYPARERPIEGVTSALVADALTAAGGRLAWRGTREELPAALAAQVLPGDVVLTVGAGDVTKVGPALLEELGGGAPARRGTPMTRTKIAAAAAGLVVLASAPFWGPLVLQRMSFFRVRRVEIVGARYLTPSDIIARLNVDTLASVWAPTDPLVSRVEKYPGVARANVRRKLPGTLVVEIVERVPVALVSAPGGLRAYDDRGTALPIDPTRVTVDAPVLMERDIPLLKLLGSIRAGMPAMYARVSAARRPGHGEIALELKPAGSIGSQTETVRANDDLTLQRLADVEPVEQDLAKKQMRATEIDLRYRDQVIARLP